MEKPPTVALVEHFASVPDPRIERHRWHKLSDILVIAVCAVLCGASMLRVLAPHQFRLRVIRASRRLTRRPYGSDG